MSIDIPDIKDFLAWDEDFPHPDWPQIEARFDPAWPQDVLHDVRCNLERQWLTLLRNHLGGNYQLHETPRVFLLSEQSRSDAQDTLEVIEMTLTQILDALEETDSLESSGKDVVVIFSEEDDYYSYISHFDPPGHFRTDDACCIRSHEVHVVINGFKQEFRRTLTHELVHSVLAGYHLPQWVEEGVVETLTRRILDEPPLSLSVDSCVAHGHLWQWHGLEAFWSGGAFSSPSELSNVSYELAELLVRAMNVDQPEAFNRFLRSANVEDAGESACREHMGVSLVYYIRQILGDGPWYPPV